MPASGLTSRYFTDAQYGKLSARQGAIILSVLTILIVFYMADQATSGTNCQCCCEGGSQRPHAQAPSQAPFQAPFQAQPQPQAPSKGRISKAVIEAAGVCALVFTALASIDGFVRPKFEHVRWFDEGSIIAGYSSLYLLSLTLFPTGTLVCLLLIFMAVVICRYYWSARYGGNPNEGQRIEPATIHIINLLEENQSQAALDALLNHTLFNVVHHPEARVTNLLVEAVDRRIGTPAPSLTGDYVTPTPSLSDVYVTPPTGDDEP